MEDNIPTFWASVIALVAFLVGLFAGALTITATVHESAIKAGYAQYHPTTGEWEWKK